ncbi:MAG TPA: hypothetical protein DCP07_08130 [Lachnospiraceae bacterium]|nr:hypothetical protein [Lachnospiraceae bacterium]
MPEKTTSSPTNNNRKKSSKKKTRYNPLLLPCAVLFLSTIVCLVLCIITSAKLGKADEKLDKLKTKAEATDNVTLSPDELDGLISSASANASLLGKEEVKAQIVEMMSVPNPNEAEMLRTMFPEKIVYLAPDGYHFDDISDNIPKNDFKKDSFSKDDDGYVVFNGDNKEDFLAGIDVSAHQGTIDWEKVAEGGNIKFAMIRTGFRGYGSGKMVADEEFENNVKGALENNIDVGVYFFSQATSKDEMQEEIDFVLETIAPYKINCPVVIDIEKVDDSSARGNTISKEERTEYVKLFCDQVKEKGYTPMIYGNTYSLFAMLNMDELAEYDVWYAFYSSYIYYPYKVRMWQYSEKFEVPGIDGKVDMNVIIPN